MTKETTDATPTAISPHVAENIDRVLKAIRAHFGMDIAFVSEFLGTTRIFRNVDAAPSETRLKAGDVLSMAQGYCGHIVAGRLPELIPDTNAIALARSIPETGSFPIGAHLSVPIRVDGSRVFGTFCCLSYEPIPALNERDLGLMRAFSEMLANELTADVRTAEARAEKIRMLEESVAAGDPQIVFQPIVRLDDLSMTGVEALSRFSAEPRRTPDLWFADAEEVGMGAALELLAARKAIAVSAVLPVDLAVNVNISPGTLLVPGMAEALVEIAPKRLVIEITEHVPIESYDPIIAALAPLRAAGMRVAIDDAGAGYSSLRHVLLLKPDIIKFDISLTRGIDGDPTRQAMIAAMVEFARRTDKQVVAEGIETDAECAVLKGIGVEKAQGYRFGRPQAVADILAGLKAPVKTA